MSTRYAAASVLILKVSVPPLLTLMSVAKPWMVASPTPATSHSLAGDPGLEFSQGMGLGPGASHGPAEAAGRRRTPALKASGPVAAPAAASRTGGRPADPFRRPRSARCLPRSSLGVRGERRPTDPRR